MKGKESFPEELCRKQKEMSVHDGLVIQRVGGLTTSSGLSCSLKLVDITCLE